MGKSVKKVIPAKSKKTLTKDYFAINESFYNVFNSIFSSVSIVKPDGEFIFANEKAAMNIVGGKPEDLIGKNICEVLPKKQSSSLKKKYKEVIEKGKIIKQEMIISPVTGDRYLLNVLQPIKVGKDNEFAVLSISNDITEQKKSEEELKISLAKYKVFFDFLPFGITVSDSKGQILESNQKAESLLGLSTKEHKKRNIAGKEWKIIKKDGSPFPPEEYASVRALKENKIVENIEMGIDKGDDGITWINVTAAPIPIENYGVAIAYNDVTEKKLYEDNIKKISNHFQALIEKAPDGIVLINKEGQFLYASSSARSMFGFSPTEELNKNPAEFTHPDDLPYVLSEIIKVVENPDYSPTLQYRFREKNGEYRWVESTFTNLLYDPNVEAIVINFRDITFRKEFELQLIEEKKKTEESEFRFKALHAASFGGIVVQDKGLIIECNQGLSDITGYSYEELIGMDGLNLIQKDCREEVMNKILNQYEKPYEVIGVRKNGEEYPVRIQGTTIPYKGKIVRATEFRDITPEKVTENLIREKNEELERKNKELIEAKNKAEESDRLKSAFLANMSHEIRTPMNGILGFSELLKEPDLNSNDREKYIDIIEKSGNRMLNIINDIIDISKIESGLMEVSISEVNINEQLKFIYNFFKPEAEKKGIKLSYSIPSLNEEIVINSDREKIYAILINLIKNAIKFTDKGTINLGVTVKGNFLDFFVEDTGIGIPENRKDAIFERFVQADVEDKKAFQGAGLGLSITKAYVEMLGGSIGLETEEGKGSKFKFSIPFEKYIEKQTAEETRDKFNQKIEGLSEMKIIIAEDDETSDELLTLHLKKYSNEIIHTSTGRETVELCRNNPDTEIIFMDIKMPDLNGYEATEEIRKFNKDIIIIAQTAYGLLGDEEKALQSGCDYYISKPINRAKLNSILEEIIKLKK